MACGALVIGSATPPVEEVIQSGENGLLCDFFDVEEWSNTVADALQFSDRYSRCRVEARRTILHRYDLHNVCLPAQIKLIDRLVLAS